VVNEQFIEHSGFDLGSKQFSEIAQLLYRASGIHLGPGKDSLVKSRLTKRLRNLGLSEFSQYLDYLREDRSGLELRLFVNSLTTHKTSFFRESAHFDFVRREVIPAWMASKSPVRIWCAGCSSGEEPYTLAMLLREEWLGLDSQHVQILATDISNDILQRAREGVYSAEIVRDIPPSLVMKYFRTVDRGGVRHHEVNPSLRSLISFARLNLMSQWPVKGPLQAIFCRNVMIYFDKETQRRLIRRFVDLLETGGYLFIGHSESLTGMTEDLRYVQPAAYQKC
jgi:chemotaxis protein methyltransferase CheR